MVKVAARELPDNSKKRMITEECSLERKVGETSRKILRIETFKERRNGSTILNAVK